MKRTRIEEEEDQATTRPSKTPKTTSTTAAASQETGESSSRKRGLEEEDPATTRSSKAPKTTSTTAATTAPTVSTSQGATRLSHSRDQDSQRLLQHLRPLLKLSPQGEYALTRLHEEDLVLRMGPPPAPIPNNPTEGALGTAYDASSNILYLGRSEGGSEDGVEEGTQSTILVLAMTLLRPAPGPELFPGENAYVNARINRLINAYAYAIGHSWALKQAGKTSKAPPYNQAYIDAYLGQEPGSPAQFMLRTPADNAGRAALQPLVRRFMARQGGPTREASLREYYGANSSATTAPLTQATAATQAPATTAAATQTTAATTTAATQAPATTAAATQTTAATTNRTKHDQHHKRCGQYGYSPRTHPGVNEPNNPPFRSVCQEGTNEAQPLRKHGRSARQSPP